MPNTIAVQSSEISFARSGLSRGTRSAISTPTTAGINTIKLSRATEEFMSGQFLSVGWALPTKCVDPSVDSSLSPVALNQRQPGFPSRIGWARPTLPPTPEPDQYEEGHRA